MKQRAKMEEGTAVSRTVPNLQGETELTLHVRREGNRLHIEAVGATKPWQVLLRGETSIISVTSGTAETEAQGIRLQPDKGTTNLTVQLAR